MRWTISMVAIALLGLAAGSAVLLANQKSPTEGAAVDAALKTHQKERVQAARDLVAELQKRLDAGEALTPTFTQLQMDAFERLAKAEVAAADNARDRIAAVERYVERCREVLRVVEARHANGLDVSSVQLHQARYQLADAQCMLEELRAR
jgi:hypothetical protein